MLCTYRFVILFSKILMDEKGFVEFFWRSSEILYGLDFVGEVRFRGFGHKNILHHSGSESCKCVSRVIAWVVKIILGPASRVSSISRKYMGLAWRSRWNDDDRKKCLGIAMGYCHLSSLTIWTNVVYQRSLRWHLRLEEKSWRKFERSFRTT